ncbi:MAG: hypothetical protein MPK75_05845, partial [Alphaproteobacteria bacterium]|nr:hypothetical protein [Alphaproteobacteria bacterium]
NCYGRLDLVQKLLHVTIVFWQQLYLDKRNCNQMFWGVVDLYRPCFLRGIPVGGIIVIMP